MGYITLTLGIETYPVVTSNPIKFQFYNGYRRLDFHQFNVQYIRTHVYSRFKKPFYFERDRDNGCIALCVQSNAICLACAAAVFNQARE